MKVLVGCEESGTIRDAFADAGHDATSCDLQESRSRGRPHYRGDVFDVIDFPWDLGIFHPECTHTAVSGAKHFAAKRLDGRQQAGVAFFMALWRRSAHIHGVVMEQPTSIMSTLFRKPDQIIQPWQFGHYETKATHLWFRGVDPLIPVYRSPEECREALGLPAGTKPAARVHLMAPGPNRARDRSATYPGIAAAMVRRWGLLNPPRQVAA